MLIRPLVAVLISAPRRLTIESLSPIAALYALTPAELRLVAALLNGYSLKSAAVQLKITYETTRTQLKRIFSKTGTGREAELLRVVFTTLSA